MYNWHDKLYRLEVCDLISSLNENNSYNLQKFLLPLCNPESSFPPPPGNCQCILHISIYQCFSLGDFFPFRGHLKVSWGFFFFFSLPSSSDLRNGAASGLPWGEIRDPEAHRAGSNNKRIFWPKMFILLRLGEPAVNQFAGLHFLTHSFTW